jgi:hypothetical protein
MQEEVDVYRPNITHKQKKEREENPLIIAILDDAIKMLSPCA